MLKLTQEKLYFTKKNLLNQFFFLENVNTIDFDLIINNEKKIDGIENKPTRFQIYPEAEVACKYPEPFSKHSIQKFFFVEYEKKFRHEHRKVIFNPTQPYRNRKVVTSYIPVTLSKNP